MKILVLGKDGMLGHVVYNYLKEAGNEVVGTDLKNDDIFYDAFQNQEKLEEIIQKENPKVVINCIGILNKVAEENKILAVKLNSLLPHYCDYLSEKYNFKFIHISTDCVFEGTKGKYTENSQTDALSFYGRSKALGEINNDRSITLRTSIVGPDKNPTGIGLFQWFMKQTENVNGYKKVIWTGVTTIELAKVIEKAISNNLVGLHHVVNNDFISKYDLLTLFKETFNKNIVIIPEEKTISQKTLVKTEDSFDFNLPSYKVMIKDMQNWIFNHPNLYSDFSKPKGENK